jgi:hypothetical protein
MCLGGAKRNYLELRRIEIDQMSAETQILRAKAQG